MPAAPRVMTAVSPISPSASPTPDPQAAALIAARLKQRVPVNDIILEVCQVANLPWPEAARLVRSVAARQQVDRSTFSWGMVIIPVVIGVFAVVVAAIVLFGTDLSKMGFDYRHISYYGNDDHTNDDPDQHWYRIFSARAGQIVTLHYQANITSGRMWLGIHETIDST